MTDDAIKSLQKAIDLNADYAAAHHNLGLAMAKQGDNKDLAETIQRRIELYSQGKAYIEPSQAEK